MLEVGKGQAGMTIRKPESGVRRARRYKATRSCRSKTTGGGCCLHFPQSESSLIVKGSLDVHT